MLFDGSPQRGKTIADWVKADGRGLILNAGDVVEMDQHGAVWRVQVTTKADGSQVKTTGPLQFAPAELVEELRAGIARNTATAAEAAPPAAGA